MTTTIPAAEMIRNFAEVAESRYNDALLEMQGASNQISAEYPGMHHLMSKVHAVAKADGEVKVWVMAQDWVRHGALDDEFLAPMFVRQIGKEMATASAMNGAHTGSRETDHAYAEGVHSAATDLLAILTR